MIAYNKNKLNNIKLISGGVSMKKSYKKLKTLHKINKNIELLDITLNRIRIY